MYGVYSVLYSLEVTARVSPIQKLTASGSEPAENELENLSKDTMHENIAESELKQICE